ncbi:MULTISPECIES: hypothetical protein [unclassified Mesorhizobium]|uniref:hypothetical protein n=1 Tax=unclassified Mesorhizobium TaxID=325217 RepID=UPI00112A0DBF|nr:MULTISPECIES: hypothetical protein [unclassified Mesorhizobium]MBZ9701810.1 hypothetical protein [Mesorhizobium sp. CO1-1-3]MBZ9949158.1 hypothetical protein [Mesorhizobium sp. BR1-1-11]TPI99641.1 hypothetical protein FJ428_22190 [Mesorhizobium sp. B2-8-1]
MPYMTGRTCELVIGRKQETPVVSEICDWMDAEFTTDMKRVDAQYPGLGFGADPARQENVRNPIRSSSHPASCGGF